ncbi:flagellar biosynthetic protein FliO [Orrella dioscoreae]|uniref:Flagellar protein n=2 Tax=root TaxID=1 RepID=A0A1C3JZE0_9BURK|nr:flagellar biosynthetic protein FliO [Orrella dioscoreae]SBT24528.1 Flagellar biosynthesis protein FliO [Orrella dioscoreae]SOE49555.1 Flagellar biosynthesis protein FliO [Orrella dioscoreae]
MTETALIRVVVGLLLVVATILSLAWLARRSGLLARGAPGLLKNVATLTLGPRNHVTVIQVDETWLVVGVTNTQMTLLHTQPARPLESGDATAAATTAAAPFAEKLARALQRKP